MPFQSIENEHIFYSLSNVKSSRNLILIHGAGGDHAHWSEALRNFPEVNTYGLDLPGHGNSAGQGRRRIDDYADFIEAFVNKTKLSAVTLCGHSMGGAITQTLALRHPVWLERIVLVGTGARLRVASSILHGLLDDFPATIDLICRWAYGPDAPKALTDKGREGFLKMDPKVIHGDYSACNAFDVTERLCDISVSTLVVSGTADKLTPLKYGEYLSTQIPRARLAVIENGGHMMALEKEKQFLKIMEQFMLK